MARSTLADANARRPATLYADVFATTATNVCRLTRRHRADALVILDATWLELSTLSAGWLKAQNGRRAVKMHVAYDLGASGPLGVSITDQRVSDIVPARDMVVEAGMTYVFDLAYYDYAWWAALDASGCRFVSRLKANTPLKTVAEQAVAEDPDILSDRISFLPQRRMHARRNPFADPVREVTVRVATSKVIRLVTNDLDAPATEIAGLYKKRWQIELFFKWIKQNLKSRHFLGVNENAVLIQLFVAPIAHLLLRAAHQAQNAVSQPLAFACLVRINLMHRRPVNELTKPPQLPPFDVRQLTLNLQPN